MADIAYIKNLRSKYVMVFGSISKLVPWTLSLVEHRKKKWNRNNKWKYTKAGKAPIDILE